MIFRYTPITTVRVYTLISKFSLRDTNFYHNEMHDQCITLVSIFWQIILQFLARKFSAFLVLDESL